jgi:hypothetical protein
MGLVKITIIALKGTFEHLKQLADVRQWAHFWILRLYHLLGLTLAVACSPLVAIVRVNPVIRQLRAKGPLHPQFQPLPTHRNYTISSIVEQIRLKISSSPAVSTTDANNKSLFLNNDPRISTILNDMASAADPKAKAAERKKQFMDVWPQLENSLVDLMKQHGMPDDATEWYRRVCVFRVLNRRFTKATRLLPIDRILRCIFLTKFWYSTELEL